ncbi:hypothetical protein Tco_1339994 [Tanacetum coccineum]
MDSRACTEASGMELGTKRANRSAHALAVVNSFFKKRDAHLITYHIGDHDTQIDYMLVCRGDLRVCKDYKVFLGENLVEKPSRRSGGGFTELISMQEDEANKSVVEERLDSKDGENDIYRIAKARERRKMDLGSMRFIKDKDGRSIVNEDAIRKRWKEYFFALFNGKRRGRTKEVDSICAISQNN